MKDVAQQHKRAVTATGCGFNFLNLITRQIAVLNTASQHTIPPKFGEKGSQVPSAYASVCRITA